MKKEEIKDLIVMVFVIAGMFITIFGILFTAKNFAKEKNLKEMSSYQTMLSKEEIFEYIKDGKKLHNSFCFNAKELGISYEVLLKEIDNNFGKNKSKFGMIIDKKPCYGVYVNY